MFADRPGCRGRGRAARRKAGSGPAGARTRRPAGNGAPAARPSDRAATRVGRSPRRAPDRTADSERRAPDRAADSDRRALDRAADSERRAPDRAADSERRAPDVPPTSAVRTRLRTSWTANTFRTREGTLARARPAGRTRELTVHELERGSRLIPCPARMPEPMRLQSRPRTPCANPPARSEPPRGPACRRSRAASEATTRDCGPACPSRRRWMRSPDHEPAAVGVTATRSAIGVGPPVRRGLHPGSPSEDPPAARFAALAVREPARRAKDAATHADAALDGCCDTRPAPVRGIRARRALDSAPGRAASEGCRRKTKRPNRLLAHGARGGVASSGAK